MRRYKKIRVSLSLLSAAQIIQANKAFKLLSEHSGGSSLSEVVREYSSAFACRAISHHQKVPLDPDRGSPTVDRPLDFRAPEVPGVLNYLKRHWGVR